MICSSVNRLFTSDLCLVRDWPPNRPATQNRGDVGNNKPAAKEEGPYKAGLLSVGRSESEPEPVFRRTDRRTHGARQARAGTEAAEQQLERITRLPRAQQRFVM